MTMNIFKKTKTQNPRANQNDEPTP